MSDCALLYDFDRAAGGPVAGVDEAGRGPLAGPVVAAAVVLDLDKPLDGVNDSKKLSHGKRLELYERITRQAVAWAVGIASPEEIDTLNILWASLLAMQRSLDGIQMQPACVLVDGNRAIPSVPAQLQRTVVGGDATSASIAAASIVAKVTRDTMMAAYDNEYPGYEFHRHKGYPTRLHRERIETLGLCGIHRKTFCRREVEQMDLWGRLGTPVE